MVPLELKLWTSWKVEKLTAFASTRLNCRLIVVVFPFSYKEICFQVE